MTTYTLVPWSQTTDVVVLPLNAQPPEIAQRAVLLSPRDQSALIMAFDNQAYEMAASFTWSKAMAALKKQLSNLGMEFIGEMLGRADLGEASNPITEVREDEAIELAEQLGMISTTEAIRLRNGQTRVNHFLDSNKVLTNDRHVLEKLAYDAKPLERWQDLVSELDLCEVTVDPRIAKMLTAERARSAQIKKAAQGYRERIMQEA